MDKKSKSISGLRKGKIVIQKSKIYFTEREKHQIVRELISAGCTKVEILEKIYVSRQRAWSIATQDATIGQCKFC